MGFMEILPMALGLFGNLMGGKEQDAPVTAEPEKRPDETSEGLADARQRRRSLAARTGRSGLRSDAMETGQTRGGLTIQT